MENFKDQELFYNEYYELLINRVTHSTMSLEKDLGDPDDSKNAVRLRDNMRAFKMLMSKEHTDLSEELIITIADLINSSSIYISNGYRKTGKYLADTDIEISSPENIATDMQKLLYDYKNNWNNMDPIEREARFHIDFIRIHPFEDGNGRTARLLLNFNLIKQGLHPVIITEDLNEYYESYIENKSVDGMKNLFEIQSKKEAIVFDELLREHLNDEKKGPSLT